MPPSPNKLPSTITLGWLEQQYFTPQTEADKDTIASDAIKLGSPKEAMADFAVIPRGDGEKSIRLDMKASDGIEYWNYSAPALWGVPATILRMHLEPREKRDEFVFHSGEEVVVPIRGTMRYSFLWGERGQPLEQREENVSPGQIGSIYPANPHHGWAVGRDIAEAWLVLYHDPDSSAAFDIAANLQGTKIQTDRRRLKAGELVIGSGHYALVAWEIADRIRTQRQRVGLSIHQMAELMSLDPSHLSRIENASTNLSFDALIKICKFLWIDLRSLIFSPRWCFRSRGFQEILGAPCAWTQVENKHMVHPRYFHLRQTHENSFDSCLPVEPAFSSWIVLAGHARVEIESGGTVRSAMLEEGSIVHFRRNYKLRIAALSDCQLVAFHISPMCPQTYPILLKNLLP